MRWRSMLAGLVGALGAVGSPASGQVAGSSPTELDRVMIGVGKASYTTPSRIVPATVYATDEDLTLPVEEVWRPMCGSDSRGVTPADVQAIADVHAARMANLDNQRVVDTPRYGPRAGLNIIYVLDSSVPANAISSFERAEQYIESQFSDSIAVRINVSFGEFASNILGGASSTRVSGGVAYSIVRTGLVNNRDVTDTIQPFLPSGTSVPVRYNATSATVSNVTNVEVYSATYRATIGGIGSDDSNQVYNTAIQWDFDPSNGTGGSQYSLVDVIIHETGHSMGFYSEIEDASSARISVMDLFRFAREDRPGLGNTNPDSTADFQFVAREIDFDNPNNDEAVTDLIAVEYRMSDGNPWQSSHFQSGVSGKMKPTLARGETFFPNFFRQPDLDVLDAIGWDETGSCLPPRISNSPESFSRCVGRRIDLVVFATGDQPLSLQWRKNGVDIPGATGAVYSIASIVAADAGTYDCVASNSCGSAIRVPSILTVFSPPAITTQPAPQIPCPGTSASFTVAASSTAPLSYQWRKNGVDILGATIANYTIPSALASDAASYDCVVSNSCGTVTTAAATLTLSAPPAIVQQPQGALRPSGGSPITLSVTATGANAYQWLRDLTPVPGATGPSYTISNPQPGASGCYQVVVSSSCGSETSSCADVQIGDLPVIITQPTQTPAICRQASARVEVIAVNATSYQWQFNGVDVVGATQPFVNLSGNNSPGSQYRVVVSNSFGSVISNSVTVLTIPDVQITTQPQPVTVCAGSSATFTVAATNSVGYQWQRFGVDIPGATGPSYTIPTASPADAGSYSVVMTNNCESFPSVSVLLTVNTTSINSQPQSLTRCPGQFGSFIISAINGTGFQWRKNAVNIPGATMRELLINSVSASDAGSYDCVVTGCTTVTSDAVTLTVGGPPGIPQQPQSQQRCAGDFASFSVITNAANPTFRWRRNGVNLSDGPTIAGSANSALLITIGPAADFGTYDCVVTAACGSTTSNPAFLTPRPNPTLTQQPQAVSTCLGGSASFSVATSDTAVTYQWRRGGVPLTDGAQPSGATISGATGATLSIVDASASEFGSYSCVVSTPCSSSTSSSTSLSQSPGPMLTSQPASVIRCINTSFSLIVGGQNVAAYQWRRNGVAIAGANAATYSVAAASAGDAGTYDCVLTNPCGSVTTATASVTVNTGPTISVQPLSQAVCPASAVTFSVSASASSGTLSYLWKRNGVPAMGTVTGPTYSVSSAGTNNTGTYTVDVTDACGTIVSTPAVLTTNAGPVITAHPTSQSVCQGGSATFSVSNTGSGPFTYRWQRNSVDVPGGTGPSLTVTNATAPGGGYTVIIQNSCGTTTSTSASLLVTVPPTLTSSPSSTTACQGSSVTLVASFGGGGGTSVWQRNGTTIPGATGSLLTLSAVQPADAGDYVCTTTNPCGNVSTTPATLTVNALPVITTQPTGPATLCQGAAFILSCAATSTLPVTYQWYRDATFVASGSTLTISSVLPTNSGIFTCRAINSCGTTISVAVPLTVRPRPTITQSPQSATVCLGTSHTLTATVTNATSLQWRKNNVPILDATSASYAIPFATLSDSATYDLVATNDCGTQQSLPALIWVDSAGIVLQPADQTTSLGTPVTFTVAATLATNRQWRRDGQPLSDGPGISGSSTATLVVTPTSASDFALYDCVVTTQCGVFSSAAANLFQACGAPTWSSVPVPGPTARSQAAVASYPDAGIAILFGGTNGSTCFGDTWQWDGDDWFNLNLPGPSPRRGARMAFDTRRGRILLYGGMNCAGLALNDLWSFDGVGWTQLSSSGMPGGRSDFAMAFDPVRDRLVIFGGRDSSTSIVSGNLLWELNPESSAWVLRTTGNMPSPRTDVQMTYDRVRNRMVMAGGLNISGALNASVWEYDGSNWYNINNGLGWPGRRAAAVVYHETLRRTLIIGGVTASGVTNEVWSSDGVTLTLLTTPTPGPRANAAAWYDGARGIAFTTTGQDATPLADTWTYFTPSVPNILGQPEDVQAPTGGLAAFFISASGPHLRYAWSKDGVPLVDGGSIAGVTTPLLTVDPVSPASVGAYSCTVSSSCGARTSNAAFLSLPCVADVDDGSGSGTPDGGVTIDDLLYYLYIFEVGDESADVDDGTSSGTPDGGVTIDDLLFYLARFESGC